MKFKTLDESLHSTYGSSSYDDSTSNTTGCRSHNSSGTNGRQQRIQFKHIEVREYSRTVGDNPSCSSGPPVTITWEYDPNTLILSVEEYEDARPTRRTMSQMILPRSIRTEILRKEWNVSQQQIAAAVRQGIRAKSQRRTTLGNLGKTDKVEEMIEGATKQLLRTLFLRKSTSRSIQEMDEKMKRAHQQRVQHIMTQTMKEEYSDNRSHSSHEQTKAAGTGVPPGTPTPSENDEDSISEDPLEESLEITLGGSRGKMVTASVNKEDNKPKKPMRRPMYDDSCSSSHHNDPEPQQPHHHNKQESGESASQTVRPIITAIEPEDDSDDQVVMPVTPKPIEC